MQTMTDMMRLNLNRSDILVTPPGMTAVAYATGNQLGNPMAVDNQSGQPGPIPENGLSAILQSLNLLDKNKNSLAVDIFLFNQNPSSLAAQDHNAFAPSAADLLNCIGVINVKTTDWTDAGANGQIAMVPPARLQNVMKPALGSQATALYAVCVARGAATFAGGAGALQIRFQFAQGS